MVIKPFHPNNLIPLTRCNLMMAHVSRDWSVFKQIFADHWPAFQHAHPRYQTSYYDGLVARMLGCGNPDKMGYLEKQSPKPSFIHRAEVKDGNLLHRGVFCISPRKGIFG
jgi:hypothetical protein